MSPEFTPRQLEVLQYVEDYCREHGRPPTVREVQVGLAYRSSSTVQHHLNALRARGAISSSGSGARNAVPASVASLQAERDQRKRELLDEVQLVLAMAGDNRLAREEILERALVVLALALRWLES